MSSIDLSVGLCELALQVRSTTLQMLQSPDRTALLWTPHGTSNHILWHAGHVLWVADILTVEPIAGRSELPSGWAEKFGQDSRPAETTEWPAVEEIRRLLESQLAHATELLRERSAWIVSHANEMIPQNGWPLLTGIIHGWHDEARHQGEMHLLVKQWRSKIE